MRRISRPNTVSLRSPARSLLDWNARGSARESPSALPVLGRLRRHHSVGHHVHRNSDVSVNSWLTRRDCSVDVLKYSSHRPAIDGNLAGTRMSKPAPRFFLCGGLGPVKPLLRASSGCALFTKLSPSSSLGPQTPINVRTPVGSR